ncbi:hypothetical protein M885DRAFT_500725 [Pelagophyceae sp. CCMP2097]|nr:hypothetical protein M885DRAFT_500725 [Pelagophyceae sp. CCMP2097]
MGLAGRSDKACAVCAAAVAKYSCPQCRAAYCGVACCRDHKESCAGPAAPAAPGAARCGPVAAPRDAAAANDEDDETNVLSDAHKQQLSQCGWLRQALGRRGVLELLGRILSAPHRGHALRVPPSDRARRNDPEFAELVDRMLLELGICIRDGAGVTFVGAEARLPPAGAGAPGGQRCAA